MLLSRVLKKPISVRQYLPDTRWVLPENNIGLEFEYEGVNETKLPVDSLADLWTWKEETSLKDNGAEYVFTDPLFGRDAYNALEWLVSYAKTSDWKCTKRAGIHVHLDVRGTTTRELAGLCIIYAALEPILYKWIGGTRDVSHFCLPWYKADDSLAAVVEIVRAALNDEKSDSNNTIELASTFGRYAGLNLRSLQKFGSIEFRHMGATHDLERIVDWINMIMSLLRFSTHAPRSDVDIVSTIERQGCLATLIQVFGQDLAHKLYTPTSSKEMFEIGLGSARDIAIQGCAPKVWQRCTLPKGEHPGFKKWLELNPASGTPKGLGSSEYLEDALQRRVRPTRQQEQDLDRLYGPDPDEDEDEVIEDDENDADENQEFEPAPPQIDPTPVPLPPQNDDADAQRFRREWESWANAIRVPPLVR